MAETDQIDIQDIRQLAIQEQKIHLLLIQEAAADSRRGQRYAFFLALAALGTTCFLGYLGLELAATTVGGGTVLGLVTTFIAGRRGRGS